MPEIDQGIYTAVSLKINTSAIAAITTIWPAKRDVFFAAETDTAVAAITGAYFKPASSTNFMVTPRFLRKPNKKPRSWRGLMIPDERLLQPASTSTNLRFFAPR